MSDSAATTHKNVALAEEMEAVPLSEVTIFPATKAQIHESRKRSYAAWGQGSTLEEYLERDARTDVHEVSTNGNMITW